MGTLFKNAHCAIPIVLWVCLFELPFLIFAEASVVRALMNPKILSWNPRIIEYDSFLNASECDYLVSVGETKVKSSILMDSALEGTCNVLIIVHIT